MYKQVIVIRKDLNMSSGKMAVQSCHACIGSYNRTSKNIIKKWEIEGQKKVVVKVDSKEKLFEILMETKKKKIPHYLVEDAGLTELPPSTVTALGIGPEREETLDEITRNLKLLD